MTIRNYSSNCCWQDLRMDAKRSPCRWEGRWGIYTFSKHLPQILTNCKGKNSNIAMEKQIPPKVKTKVTITRVRPMSCTLPRDALRTAVPSVQFFPQICILSIPVRNIRQTRTEGQSTKHLTCTFRNVKVVKDKVRLRDCHKPKEAETAECSVGSWNRSWKRKRILVENW